MIIKAHNLSNSIKSNDISENTSRLLTVAIE